MENIIVRKATINDLEIIQKLNNELCIKENNEFDPMINREYSFSEAGRNYFTYRIQNEGDIVGYIAGGMIEKEDYTTVTKLAEGENMYVNESYRGHGIGGKLIESFEGWCRDKQVQRIRYVASAGNTKAIEFYKRKGAKEISVVLEKNL